VKAVAILCLVALSACTTLSPQAKEVTITQDANAVKNCKAVGTVWSHPPYVLPNDWKKQMQNEAAAKSGNTVFLTENPYLSVVAVSGTAYQCGH
jgi:hypothetical protein